MSEKELYDRFFNSFLAEKSQEEIDIENEGKKFKKKDPKRMVKETSRRKYLLDRSNLHKEFIKKFSDLPESKQQDFISFYRMKLRELEDDDEEDDLLKEQIEESLESGDELDEDALDSDTPKEEFTNETFREFILNTMDEFISSLDHDEIKKLKDIENLEYKDRKTWKDLLVNFDKEYENYIIERSNRERKKRDLIRYRVKSLFSSFLFSSLITDTVLRESVIKELENIKSLPFNRDTTDIAISFFGENAYYNQKGKIRVEDISIDKNTRQEYYRKSYINTRLAFIKEYIDIENIDRQSLEYIEQLLKILVKLNVDPNNIKVYLNRLKEIDINRKKDEFFLSINERIASSDIFNDKNKLRIKLLRNPLVRNINSRRKRLKKREEKRSIESSSFDIDKSIKTTSIMKYGKITGEQIYLLSIGDFEKRKDLFMKMKMGDFYDIDTNFTRYSVIQYITNIVDYGRQERDIPDYHEFIEDKGLLIKYIKKYLHNHISNNFIENIIKKHYDTYMASKISTKSIQDKLLELKISEDPIINKDELIEFIYILTLDDLKKYKERIFNLIRDLESVFYLEGNTVSEYINRALRILIFANKRSSIGKHLRCFPRRFINGYYDIDILPLLNIQDLAPELLYIVHTSDKKTDIERMLNEYLKSEVNIFINNILYNINSTTRRRIVREPMTNIVFTEDYFKFVSDLCHGFDEDIIVQIATKRCINILKSNDEQRFNHLSKEVISTYEDNKVYPSRPYSNYFFYMEKMLTQIKIKQDLKNFDKDDLFYYLKYSENKDDIIDRIKIGLSKHPNLYSQLSKLIDEYSLSKSSKLLKTLIETTIRVIENNNEIEINIHIKRKQIINLIESQLKRIEKIESMKAYESSDRLNSIKQSLSTFIDNIKGGDDLSKYYSKLNNISKEISDLVPIQIEKLKISSTIDDLEKEINFLEIKLSSLESMKKFKYLADNNISEFNLSNPSEISLKPSREEMKLREQLRNKRAELKTILDKTKSQEQSELEKLIYDLSNLSPIDPRFDLIKLNKAKDDLSKLKDSSITITEKPVSNKPSIKRKFKNKEEEKKKEEVDARKAVDINKLIPKILYSRDELTQLGFALKVFSSKSDAVGRSTDYIAKLILSVYNKEIAEKGELINKECFNIRKEININKLQNTTDTKGYTVKELTKFLNCLNIYPTVTNITTLKNMLLKKYADTIPEESIKEMAPLLLPEKPDYLSDINNLITEYVEDYDISNDAFVDKFVKDKTLKYFILKLDPDVRYDYAIYYINNYSGKTLVEVYNEFTKNKSKRKKFKRKETASSGMMICYYCQKEIINNDYVMSDDKRVFCCMKCFSKYYSN